MAEPYLSQMNAFACNFTVMNWARCKGQLMAISQNGALFSLLGTLYGGDGRTTFGLPNLQGRVPLGVGETKVGPDYEIGQSQDHPFAYVFKDNLPNISIPVTVEGKTEPVGTRLLASTAGPDTNNPANAYQGTFPVSQPVYASHLSNPPVHFGEVLVPSTPLAFTTAQTEPLGAAQPIDVRQPYLAVNWQICITGIFPTRGGA